jgi:hypothetical protein
VLALAQQRSHLLGVQEARDAQEVQFVIGSDVAARAELAAVEEDAVE